jgi:hypothetical protein
VFDSGPVSYRQTSHYWWPDGRVTEMIQLSSDGLHRARTWHWFRAQALDRITLVRERRASRDPADWPTVHTSPDLSFLENPP